VKLGDQVLISVDGRVLDGEVLLASANGKSLLIGFDAMIGGHLMQMPLLLEHDGVYRSIIDGTEVALTLKRRSKP
jgi:hypothetical protein